MAVASVQKIASYLGVSVQRVRVLLGRRRLLGAKNPATGAWEVPYPPTLSGGLRGPRLGHRPRTVRGGKSQSRNGSAKVPAEGRK